jgi:hypothetical protein
MNKIALATLALISTALPASAQPAPVANDWREQYAYTLGMQAYIYGFPYVYMSEVRWGK